MAFVIREIEPLTARGATGAAKGVFGLRELPREQQSNVAIQAGSGAVEGLARTAALPVDAPSIFGAAADWVGGKGTSAGLAAGIDSMTALPMALGSHAYNKATSGVADALGLGSDAKARIPKLAPTLSQNYQSLKDVAGGDAVVGGLKNAGVVSKIDPENASQRYARAIGTFVGGSAIPVGMTLNAAKNAARAGTAGSFLAPVAANPAKFVRSNLLSATTGAAAGEGAYDLTGSETARFAGGLLGGFIPGVSDAAFRRLMTGGAAGREAIREGVALYNDIGAMPTLGQATAQVPGIGGQVARFLDRTSMAFNPRLYESRLAEQAAGAERATKNAIASATNDLAAPPPINLADLLDPVGAIKNPAEYAKRVSEQLGKVGASLEDATGIQQKMMPSDVTAGAAAQAGGKEFKNRFMQAARNEYQKLDELLPKQSPATLDSTLAALNEIVTPVPGAPATSARLASKTIGGWQKALLADIDAAQKAGTAIPYDALRKIRSRVYEALNKEGDGLAPSASRADLQKLYGAITDDMRATAQAVGGDAAVAQLDRANSIYAEGAKRLEEVFDPLLKADTPEGVFRAIQSADASRLAQFLASIAPEQRASITGRIFAKMGQARNADGILTGSEFDFNTFLTNYKNMSKSRSLEVLFNAHNNPNLGGAGVKQMKAALDKLADMASRTRFMERQLYNPSGTAARLTENFMNAGVPMAAGVGLLSGGLSPVAAGGLVALRFLGKAGASALNSPKFLQYLSQTPSITSQKWPAHFSRLALVAEREGLGPEVHRLAEDVGKRSLEDRLTFALSPIPGLGGVVATANDVRKYTKGERDLSAENMALTAMNIIPEHAALRGLEDASGALARMSDPAMGAVGLAARDPQTFLKSLELNVPKNQGLNIAGAVSEPLARAAGVPVKEGEQPQPPAEPTEVEKFLSQFGPAQQPQQQSQNQAQQPQQQPQSGMSDADLLGGRAVNFLESVLLGGGDELLAFLQSPVGEQLNMIGLQSGAGTPTYDRELKTARGLLDRYRKDFPVESFTVGLGAGVATPLGAAGKFISRGKGAIGQGARAAAAGAGFGAATGFGMGRGEERAQSAADGAFWGSLIGGGLGVTVPAVANGIKWIRDNPTAFNAATGVLSRDGAAIAKAAGINPKGMERELNFVFQQSVDIANQIMKDPQGARNLIRRGIDGLAKRGGADIDGNLLLRTIENVFGDKTSAYDPVWRRVFGEGLSPDKPLGRAVKALIDRKIGPDAQSWQPVLTRVLAEVEKRVGPVGPQSRFWNVDDYQPAPIAPKIEAVDEAMRGVTAAPEKRMPAPPAIYKKGGGGWSVLDNIGATFEDMYLLAAGKTKPPAWLSAPITDRKAQAIALEASGADRKAIWRQTGMVKPSKDAKWRAEIYKGTKADYLGADVMPLPSMPMRLTPQKLEGSDLPSVFFPSDPSASSKPLPVLSDLIDSPELFEAAPYLKDTKIGLGAEIFGVRGAYLPKRDVDGKVLDPAIVFQTKLDYKSLRDRLRGVPSEISLDAKKDLAAHEITHAIQDRYGQVRDIVDASRSQNPVDGFRKYWTSPHEVEARMVEKRARMSNARKWNKAPSYDAGSLPIRAQVAGLLRGKKNSAAGLAGESGVTAAPPTMYSNKQITGTPDRVIPDDYIAAPQPAELPAWARFDDDVRKAMAKKLAGQNASPERIWKTTGLIRGPDGVWRKEINETPKLKFKDVNGRLTEEVREKVWSKIDEGEMRLGDLIDAPQMFRAAPYLKKIKVLPDYTPGRSASYHNGVMLLSPDLLFEPKALMQSIVHEAQHAVQQAKNLPVGGNPAMFMKEALYELDPKLKPQQRADAMQRRKTDGANALKRYMNLAGETEARLAERRIGMTPADRYAVMPKYDTPLSDQSLIYGGRLRAMGDSSAPMLAPTNLDAATSPFVKFKRTASKVGQVGLLGAVGATIVADALSNEAKRKRKKRSQEKRARE